MIVSIEVMDFRLLYGMSKNRCNMLLVDGCREAGIVVTLR